MTEFIVVYDIGTPDLEGHRRLARVAKLCEGYGVRVQKSVFECRLAAASVEQFVHELRQIIDARSDQVTLYAIPGNLEATRTELGRRPDFTVDGPWIV